jgi:hypothetical protein
VTCGAAEQLNAELGTAKETRSKKQIKDKQKTQRATDNLIAHGG